MDIRKKFAYDFCEGCDLCEKWAEDIYNCNEVYDAYYERASDEERKELEG